MADYRLNTEGDLDIEGNSFVLVDGVDAVAQDLNIRLGFFRGEWFLDTRLGVPYFQKLLGEKPQISVVKEIFRKAILGTPGVLSLSDFEVSYDGRTRRINIRFRAITTTGYIVYNKDLII